MSFETNKWIPIEEAPTLKDGISFGTGCFRLNDGTYQVLPIQLMPHDGPYGEILWAWKFDGILNKPEYWMPLPNPPTQ